MTDITKHGAGSNPCSSASKSPSYRPSFSKSLSGTKAEIVPVSLGEANCFIEKHHRHHGGVVGHKFSIGISDGEQIRGVAVVGRPVARMLDDGWTLEVTRCCTDGIKNGCSMLYAAALILSTVLSVLTCWLVRRFAIKRNIVDQPFREPRKIHVKPMPLLGGLGIFLSFFLVLGYFALFTDKFYIGQIEPKNLIGLFVASLVLVFGGSGKASSLYSVQSIPIFPTAPSLTRLTPS